MISGLIIRNQNIIGLPSRVEVMYKCTLIPVFNTRKSILGLLPHIFSCAKQGSVLFNEVPFEQTEEDQKVDEETYKSSLIRYIELELVKKAQRISGKMELVKHYFMLNDIDRVKAVLKLMNKTPNVKMLEFVVNTRIGKTKSNFDEFLAICQSVDLHTMLIFILDQLCQFSGEQFFQIYSLIAKRVKNEIKRDPNPSIVPEISEYTQKVTNLFVFIQIKMAEILISTAHPRMASLFYFQAAKSLDHLDDVPLKRFLLSKSFELLAFEDSNKGEILKSYLDEECKKELSFFAQSDLDKFFILNNGKIRKLKITRNEYSESSGNEEKKAYQFDKNFIDSQSNENVKSAEKLGLLYTDKNIPDKLELFVDKACKTSKKVHNCANSIRMISGHKFYEFKIIKRELKNLFYDRIEIKIDEQMIPSGVIGIDGCFYPAVKVVENFFIFPERSLEITKLILDDGLSIPMNRKFEKIELETGLNLIALFDATRDCRSTLPQPIQSHLAKYDTGNTKILIFEFLNNLQCKFFAIQEQQSILYENKVYFILMDPKELFVIDVEVKPNIYQTREYFI